MTPDQEKRLVNAIVAAFGDEAFDATSIILKATDDDDETALTLANAIEAAIPNCRYNSSHRHRLGLFRDASVRCVLKPLADKHFEIDEFGWWHVRQRQSVVA